jgi:predicted transposase YdaD
VLSQTRDRAEVLRQVAAMSEMENSPQQSNVAASTSILAGLVLEKDLVKRILRRELMQDSVIYQDIQEEKAQQIALNMVREGIALELIARVTGLTVEQLQRLQVNSGQPAEE